jgi:esterase/lipase
MRLLKIVGVLLMVLVVVYLCGPNPSTPVYNTTLPNIPTSATGLQSYIQQQESQHKLRPNNQARIVWYNDSVQQPTDYAIVYIHGFSASQEEGNPAHQTIAKKFSCNLYLARLAEHGIDTTEQLVNLTADAYWETAKQALAIGLQLGKKIILMSTSTGGTLSLKLAATYPDKVAGLIMYSPNVEINDPNAWLLNNPWGLQIARAVTKSNYITPADTTAAYAQYWNTPYRLEAAVQLQELVETTMTDDVFKKITQPTLALYYYKDAANQDKVVKVEAIQKMMATIATPANKKRAIALPNVGNHVIASPIKSKDVASVLQQTELFLTEVMQLKPIQ